MATLISKLPTGSSIADGDLFVSDQLQSNGISYKSIQQSALAVKTYTNNGLRTVLTQATTYYVSTTGNNSAGTGTQSNPWATLQYAMDTLGKTIDAGGYNVTIQFSDGTYAGPEIVYPIPNAPVIVIQGNTADQTKVTLNDSVTGFSCFDGGAPCQVYHFSFLTVSPASASSAGVSTDANYVSAIFDHVTFVGALSSQEAVTFFNPNCSFVFQAGCRISGTWKALFDDESCVGRCEFNNGFTFVSTPIFNTAVIMTAATYVSMSGTWSGSFTGTPIQATLPGYVNNPTKLAASPLLVAGLPSAGHVGTRSFVTDSNATLVAGIGNVVAGSGSNKVPVYDDGTNWRIG